MNELTRRRIHIAMVFVPIALVLFVAWNERTALFPFLLGVAIAYVIAPAVNWIAGVMPFRKRDPYLARGLAILILYAGVAGIGTGLGFLLVPQAIDEIQQFSDDLPSTIDTVQERFKDWYDRYVPAEQHDRVDEWLTDFGDAAGAWAADLAPDVLSFAGNTFTIIIGYLTIPIWLYFTLKDHPRGVRSFIGMFPPDWRHDVRNTLGIADAVLRHYIRAMLIQGMIIGVMALIFIKFWQRRPGVTFFTGVVLYAALFEDPNVFGPFLIPILVIVLEDRLNPRLLKPRPTLLALAVVVIAVGVVLSYSRAAWANLVLAVVVMLGVLAFRRRGGRAAFRLLTTLVVVGLTAAVFLQSTGGAELFEQRAQLQGYDSQRFGAQRIGVELSMAHPVGVGPGQFQYYSPVETHSTYVRVLSEQGLLALLLTTVIFGGTLLMALGNALSRGDTYGIGSAALLGIWCGILLNSFVIDTLHWRHLWVVAPLIWVGWVTRQTSRRVRI